ncbi:MAG: hypothetical protein VYC39_19755 [Myxococcota bacterium]|nr:hypothetical protein [Myxococcota bacterium]
MIISMLASATAAPEATIYFGTVENDRAGRCRGAIQTWLANEVRVTDVLSQATARLEVEKYNKALRLRLFDVPSNKLIEAKTFRLRNGCKFSPRINSLAKQWIRRIFVNKAVLPPGPQKKLLGTGLKIETSREDEEVIKPMNRTLPASPPAVSEPPDAPRKQRVRIVEPAHGPSSNSYFRILTRFTLAQARISFREPRNSGLSDFELPLGGFAEAALRYRHRFGTQLYYGPDVAVRYRRSLGLFARSPDAAAEYPTSLDWLSLRVGGYVSVLYLGVGLSRGSFEVGMETDEPERKLLPEHRSYGVGPLVGLSVPLSDSVTLGLETELTILGEFSPRDIRFGSSDDIYGLRASLELQVALSRRFQMLAGFIYEQQSIDLGESLLSGGVENRFVGGHLSLAFSN